MTSVRIDDQFFLDTVDLAIRGVAQRVGAGSRVGQRTPREDLEAAKTEAYVGFTSGYVQRRALAELPKQDARHPEKVHQNYLNDRMMMCFGMLDDSVIEFK